jgi:hypothetical protein
MSSMTVADGSSPIHVTARDLSIPVERRRYPWGVKLTPPIGPKV